MKLELLIEDGTIMTIERVVSFKAIETRVLRHVVAQPPTEGKLFEVNPLEINRSLFEKPMRDLRQERTRGLINEAFAEVDKHPEKYASAFYTLIPNKKWNKSKSVAELKKYAKDLGGEMANWVEQALEWAQRISNGESWDTICNYEDTATWYRMVIWKDNFAYLVGNPSVFKSRYSASYIHPARYHSLDHVYNTVPLVVIRK